TGKLVSIGTSSTLAANTFAIVNGQTITLPWTFTDKSGTGNNQALAGEFLEVGVDLTGLGLSGCFSTFEGETRSSTSPTATLSDFVCGSSPLCSLGTPQQAGLSKVGDSFTYHLVVKNTGVMPLYIQSVSDTLLGNIVVNHQLQQPGASGVNQFVTSISSAFNF